MKTLKRYLCAACEKGLADANLVYKKVPGTDGQRDTCAWCGRRCYGAEYEIQYGRDRK